MTNETLQHSALINLDRYPIFNLSSSVRTELVMRCRADLEENLYVALPNFIQENALQLMAKEAIELRPQAYHNNSMRNCYLQRDIDPELPTDHARNMQDRSSVRMLAYDQIPQTSLLKQFYHCKAVKQFIAEIVGQKTLFDNVDPYQPANYVCYNDGDESSWHFDSDNSFTMTLMVQAADHGGLFQMSPNTRTDSDQNYDHVAQVLNDERADTVATIAREPGALCIFRGCNSLHRVSPVEGDTMRIMGVFVYETEAGVAGDSEVSATIYGSRVSKLLEKSQTG